MVITIAESTNIPKGRNFGLKNLARNPTGFRRWDEWLGVLHG